MGTWPYFDALCCATYIEKKYLILITTKATGIRVPAVTAIAAT